MYLLYQLKIPSALSEQIEEELYLYEKLSWEKEETEKEVLLKFYFPLCLKEKEEEKINFLENLCSKYENISSELKLIKKENWEEIWKYHFKPLEIGKNFLILPPWEEAPKNSTRLPIYIYPGQAFGTGHHPTTQLMLEYLENYISKISATKEKPFVLDMGCGTGILTVATAKLCPQAIIYAIDIDELAIAATKKTLELNHLSSNNNIFVFSSLPQDISYPFDLILANIGSKELKKLAPIFKNLSAQDITILLLSGILKEDLPEMEKFYKNFSFKTLKTQFLQEWAILALKAI